MRNRLQEPDGGALARLVIEHECWAEELPPLPAGHAVTVAFSTEDVAAEHAEAIERLGYRVVGAHRSPDTPPAADFLVSEALIESHPTWWRALIDRADEVYVLELGPARRAISPALRVHGYRGRPPEPPHGYRGRPPEPPHGYRGRPPEPPHSH